MTSFDRSNSTGLDQLLKYSMEFSTFYTIGYIIKRWRILLRNNCVNVIAIIIYLKIECERKIIAPYVYFLHRWFFAIIADMTFFINYNKNQWFRVEKFGGEFYVDEA